MLNMALPLSSWPFAQNCDSESVGILAGKKRSHQRLAFFCFASAENSRFFHEVVSGEGGKRKASFSICRAL